MCVWVYVCGVFDLPSRLPPQKQNKKKKMIDPYTGNIREKTDNPKDGWCGTWTKMGGCPKTKNEQEEKSRHNFFTPSPFLLFISFLAL